METWDIKNLLSKEYIWNSSKQTSDRNNQVKILTLNEISCIGIHKKIC